ncbi:FecCD family ABC transporter permease [Kurthia sibirica]|uniref:Iron ABC transporter permease n=1 Tax=Kurthia sibirica TaxID=202750 RepID=A0A2U3AL64_9BACL|nr:iron ABC transporter permease [Kurthia sibirica]GEK33773.1 iron(3+)-hydroxamate import system permease protein FhuG [Kurthia sibirica]
MMKDRKFFGLIVGGFLLLLMMMFLSINAGFIKIPFDEVIDVLFGNGTEDNILTIFDFRLPRIFMAALVGMGIAVSGAILQGITRNPLADPGVLGINAGAGLGVVLYMFFLQGSAFMAQGFLSIFLMPIVALCGAFLAATVIYVLAWKKNAVNPTRMLLVGIGINAFCGALLIVFQLKMDPMDFTKALVWLAGTIWGSNWTFVWALTPWLVVLIPLAVYKAKVLDIMTLSEASAISVGLHINRERRNFLLIAVTLAGVCVAVGGGITFLGLIAPHIVRKLIGANHKKVLPLSALFGAIILVMADMLGRVVMSPLEIPVGIVVAIIGAPYFVYLLVKN